MRNNKVKRMLDNYELQAALEECEAVATKKDEEYIREGHVPIKDDVEDAMLKKYKDFKDRGSMGKEEKKIV